MLAFATPWNQTAFLVKWPDLRAQSRLARRTTQNNAALTGRLVSTTSRQLTYPAELFRSRLGRRLQVWGPAPLIGRFALREVKLLGR
jgi:hypothetical protein